MNKTGTNDGFALISALVVLALVTSVTVAMAVTQRQGIEITTEHIRNEQLKHHGDAILLWANGTLVEDLEKNNIDGKNDVWNKVLADVEIQGGKVDAYIMDLQGKINLNNLALDGKTGDLARARFKRLLNILAIEVDITSAIADWIDTDLEVRFPGGAEDDYYLSLDIPYRAGNQVLVSVSEILLIKNVDREIFFKLQPFITALPIGVNININTAPKQVLLSLSDEMNESAVESLINLRAQSPITALESTGETGGESTADTNTTTTDITAKSTTSENAENNSQHENSANNWTWTALKELQERLDREAAANEATSNSSKTEDETNGSSSAVTDPSEPQSLSDAGLDDYDIDMTGLTVNSNYFRVSGQVEQYERILTVDYVLYRDKVEKKTKMISRNFNGFSYE